MGKWGGEEFWEHDKLHKKMCFKSRDLNIFSGLQVSANMKKLPLNIALFLLQIGYGSTAPLNQANVVSCIDTCHPHDCSDMAAQGLTSDGVYLIYPGGANAPPVPVYCDMSSAGGPWTVFQKRFDGGVDFYRGWEDYESGFGLASGEYWLGLQNIFLLTQKKSYRLRIDLEDFENDTRHVTYDSFSLSPLAVNPDEDGYKLHIDGFKEGDPTRRAGNSILGHNQFKFSTHDHDRDMYVGNCAVMYHGAFWYNKCHGANLNGKYQNGVTTEYATGVVWASWKGAYYSLKRTEMKISPTSRESSKQQL
ncbi:microfibril-associated glycoprotein 4-like isoform X1 [Bufo bufo]|uniref:microfibril-associated glycoprotein 4-like isoform X1 n=2 Tax=Bufo bufo TaxID=8384 RepID=UPI001ABDB6D0|nr:microfibril-associated glycoprotein 4-like isoform X1 [Bufo bufo]